MVKREAIKKDITFLFARKDLMAVLLYGSVVKGDETPRSDIDICLVAPTCKDKAGLLREVHRNLDVYEMFEYFYYFRKLWEDQASRQHVTREELAAMLG